MVGHEILHERPKVLNMFLGFFHQSVDGDVLIPSTILWRDCIPGYHIRPDELLVADVRVDDGDPVVMGEKTPLFWCPLCPLFCGVSNRRTKMIGSPFSNNSVVSSRCLCKPQTAFINKERVIGIHK